MTDTQIIILASFLTIAIIYTAFRLKLYLFDRWLKKDNEINHKLYSEVNNIIVNDRKKKSKQISSKPSKKTA